MSINNDELLTMGFGELTEEEEARLIAELSEDEAQELAEWTQMSRDLKRLKEMPPCQLTADHLRDAILNQGIKPAKPGISWSWLSGLGLAAAACFAFAAYLTYGYYQPVERGASSQVASNHGTEELSAPSVPTVKRQSPVAAKVKPKPAFKMDAPLEELDFDSLMANSDQPDYPTTVRRSSRVRRSSMVQAVNRTEEPVADAIPAPAPSMKEESSAAMTAAAMPEAAPAPVPSGDIVVINAPTVGVQQNPPAEVDRTANVVFGG